MFVFSSQVMEPRPKLHNESKKTAAKQEAVPDMEDSPPVSDSDVSIGLPMVAEAARLSPFQVFLGACAYHNMCGCIISQELICSGLFFFFEGN